MYVIHVEKYSSFLGKTGVLVPERKLVQNANRVLFFKKKDDAQRSLKLIRSSVSEGSCPTLTVLNRTEALRKTPYYAFSSDVRISYEKCILSKKKAAIIKTNLCNGVQQTQKKRSTLENNNDEIVVPQEYFHAMPVMKQFVCDYNVFIKEMQRMSSNIETLHAKLISIEKQKKDYEHVVEVKGKGCSDAHKIAVYDLLADCLQERRVLKNRITFNEQVLSKIPEFDVNALKQLMDVASGLEGKRYKCRELTNEMMAFLSELDKENDSKENRSISDEDSFEKVIHSPFFQKTVI